MCNACISLNSGYEDFTLHPLNPEGDVYKFGQRKTDLLEFKLLRVTQDVISPDSESYNSQIVLTLHLKGLYEYHLLNSFAPSALMFFISFSSLFFPMENFNERIMVSLTALLVLATLFAQASNSSVRTPYLKLLDVWYAAMIAFCFFVVLINVVVNSLIPKKSSSTFSPEVDPINLATIDGMTVKVGWSSDSAKDKKEKGSNARLNRAAICNLASVILMLIMTITLILVYILMASGTI